MSKHTIVTISARKYQDSDDCLIDAARDYVATHPDLAGWDLEARWEDEQRDAILLTVPTWAVR